MSRAAAVVVAFAFLTSASAASAGPFGGFAADGSYLVGGERLCKPITTASAMRDCRKVATADVARMTLERPKSDRGARARFAVRASGTKLSVTALGASAPVLVWDTGSPAGRVQAVFINKAGDAVAVEYESRFGGRMVTEVIGFRIKTSTATVSSTPSTPTTPTTPGAPKLSDDDQKKLEKHLHTAWSQLKRSRYKKAATAATAALTIWDQSAEALAVLASSRARLKDKDGALAALDRLAVSSDPAAPEYRVDARTASAFASLRANPRFRRAVGITPDPNRPLSAYERVMGFGGKWEQRLIACDQPEVKLKLRRARKRFTLRIKARCGGPADTTFLDGTWSAVGTDVLRLVFPNQGANDEPMLCQIERCRDSSGEDCVRCKVDAELEFLLRVIRR